MPIFSRKNERILFAHIPKTAGSSIVAWFLANDWNVSNLIVGDDGLADYVLEHHGIGRFDLEGAQSSNVTPQHATIDTTRTWGDFSYRFAIVRHPVARYCSQVKYAAHAYFRKRSEVPTAERFNWFCGTYHGEVSEHLPGTPALQDNHFRLQASFVDDTFDIFKVEEKDWGRGLAKRFSLKGALPKLNASSKGKSGTVPLDDAKLTWVFDTYELDFDRFGYDRSNPYEL